MVRFIDEHRGKFGVEPICAVLPIAPSVYSKQRARQRRARTGALRSPAQRGRAADSSLGPRHAISLDSLHRAPGRGGHRAFRRQHGRFVRQRARGVRHRSLQDGSDPPTRAVERSRRGGVRDAGVGRVVQHASPARAARLRAAGRVRAGGKVRRCGNEGRRCSLRFGEHEPRARETPERRRHRPWGRRAPRPCRSQA